MASVIDERQSDWNHQVYWVSNLMDLIDDGTKSMFQIYGLLHLIKLPYSWFVTIKAICIKRNHESNIIQLLYLVHKPYTQQQIGEI